MDEEVHAKALHVQGEVAGPEIAAGPEEDRGACFCSKAVPDCGGPGLQAVGELDKDAPGAGLADGGRHLIEVKVIHGRENLDRL